ncbi:MAG: serine hydrolase [Ignavibacteriae bacterium]|nr:serine hydrolase [Ignavibacteriota bacterium]
MRTILSIFCLILLFILSLSEHATCQSKKLTENEIQIISDMMDKYEQIDLFSGVLLLAKDNKIVFKKAYGFADRENKIRNNVGTKFHLASVSKLFTLVAILELFNEGKLDMNDKIGRYLEGFSSDISDKVTVLHLITMTSGFGNYMDNEEFQKDPAVFRSVNDLIRMIRKEKLLFEPGSSERYSNSGFVLLGGIIEKVTGKDYFEYIENTICLPAGMNQTYFFDSSAVKNEALGYNRNLNGEYNKVFPMFPPCPAGNAHSSAEDLLKFALKVCTTGDFLSDKAKVIFYSDFDTNYKGDWNTLKSNPKRVFGWSGGTRGISTVLRYYIGEELSIIILSNYTNISDEIWQNIRSIMTNGNYNEILLPVTEKFYKAFKENGIEFIKSNFAEWTKNCTPEKSNILPESILNEIGYELIREQNLQDAIAVFKLNAELFPAKWNPFDSLGEAYMLSGNKKSAIENYEKSLKMNPENSNAFDKLKELKGE